MVISVLDHVSQCFSAADGHVIRDVIVEQFRRGISVTVSMQGVGDIPSSFANGAFANLVAAFGYDHVITNLKIIDASPQVADMIRRCVANARKNRLVA